MTFRIDVLIIVSLDQWWNECAIDDSISRRWAWFQCSVVLSWRL